MTENDENVTVVIREGEHCRLGTALDSDTALTLIAVASEDPSCWEDMVAYWPRYSPNGKSCTGLDPGPCIRSFRTKQPAAADPTVCRSKRQRVTPVGQEKALEPAFFLSSQTNTSPPRLPKTKQTQYFAAI